MSKTKVVHCKYSPYDIYIGRGSKWGNPARIGPDGNRNDVIVKHKIYLVNRPDLLREVHMLSGQTLGCYCKYPNNPLPCHGDWLAWLANLGDPKLDEWYYLLISDMGLV